MSVRPDPEELLRKYDNKPKAGKLTIFLGAAAGVGKTYAMLKTIPELINDGIDVVIGYVETHKRAETQALLPDNVEQVPLKEFIHHNHKLYEVDVDTIINRNPQLVILDELAHSNVAGSRNLKRYQDVLELLSAGIDVYTALNIQHIESLNDIVSQITGVKVNETVPDSIIENANEIKLIDITPDELIERLRDGKIYSPDRAAKALENFFRKGNLTALREMSLLKTAQKVEQQVQEYRTDNAIDNVWASHENLLVVIEPGYSSEKIIRSGKTMFDKGFSKWFVVYVDNDGLLKRPLRDREKLLELLELARQLGAETKPLTGTNPTEVVVSFARDHNINTMILSQYRLNLYYRLFGASWVDKITELAPEINLHLVSDELVQNKNILSVQREQQQMLNYRSIAGKIIRNILVFSFLGLLLLPVSGWLANENIIMLYLLVIIIVNHGRGKFSATIAALIATVSFDFFFIPPRFSFAIGDLQYIITFIVMTVVGISFSIVTGNLRFQVSALRKAQNKSKLLYESSKKLAEAMIEEQVFEIVKAFLPELFAVKYALLIPNSDEALHIQENTLEQSVDMSIAHWVFDRGQSAGLNTNTFAASSIYYIPINSQIRTRGVIAFVPDSIFNFFLPEQQELLANFASSLATTLERIHFTQVAIETEVLLAQQKSNASNQLG